MMERPPEMSIVIVSPQGLDPIRRTLRVLARQTARERLEVVIVDCGGLPGDPSPPAPDGFRSVRILDGRGLRSTGAAIAAGVRATSAPIVACAEEHSFPEPGWAAAIIDAHAGPWAAVAGVLENANPKTRTSWAALLSDFGPAVAPAPGGEASELASHHTAYKRSALDRYGEHLDRMLEVEWVLQDDLRAAGQRLYREPAAVSHHINVSRPRSHLLAEFDGGRVFAGNRARYRGWGIPRRMLWAGGSPLQPLVRLARSRADARRCRPRKPGLTAVLTVGFLANAAGQMLGYAFGPGRSVERRMGIELNRQDHIRRDERTQLTSTVPEDLPRLSLPN